MAFHRFTIPVYTGGLRPGDDYLNNALVGTPAVYDGPRAAGPNMGTYFIGFGEGGQSQVWNRGLAALAENTDFLDDYCVDLDDAVVTLTGALAAEAAARTAFDDNTKRIRTLAAAATLNNPAQDATILLTVGGYNLTLPTANANVGWRYRLVNIDGLLSGANAVTLVPNGAETINGVAANLALSVPYGAWELISTGATSWQLLPLHANDAPAPTKTTNFTVSGEFGFYPIDTTATTVTATLPSPALFKGRTIVFKDVKVGGGFQTNALIVVPAGAEKIENIASLFVYEVPGGRLRLYSDGTDWWFV